MWIVLLKIVAGLVLINAAVWTFQAWGLRACVSVAVSGALLILYVPEHWGGVVVLISALLITLFAYRRRLKPQPRARR